MDFLAFWETLCRHLRALGHDDATYEEARDFFDSGYTNPREVADQWIGG